MQITAEEAFESLTGFDEIAIAKWFGGEVIELGGTTLGRALIFVAKRREGLTDAEAHNAALELSIGDLTGYFAAGDEESGKDSPQSEPQPEGSPTSA